MSSGREVLVRTLEELAAEARSENGDSWENVTLSSFLEAMGAWLSVYEYSYINTGRPVPDDPWEIVAEAVRAATIYE
ncbi:MAG TPA: hypothetical protein VF444_13930 [Pseudonocardiaceae bacterium]